ncbi:hypothetical protein KM043_005409 [Ampulex compressa]|nr:hypothetical protein KM043_005409 [Ampulex compressa]
MAGSIKTGGAFGVGSARNLVPTEHPTSNLVSTSATRLQGEGEKREEESRRRGANKESSISDEETAERSGSGVRQNLNPFNGDKSHPTHAPPRSSSGEQFGGRKTARLTVEIRGQLENPQAGIDEDLGKNAGLRRTWEVSGGGYPRRIFIFLAPTPCKSLAGN